MKKRRDSLKYGIIATVIDSKELTGIEKYAYQFIKNTPVELHKYIIVFCHPNGTDLIDSLGLDIKVITSPFENRILTDQIWLPWVIRQTEVDVVYNLSLSYPILGYGNRKFASIIHDATPWRYRETISNGMKYYYLPQLNSLLRNSKLYAIITVSQSSKNDISKYCSVAADKIYVIHSGIDAEFLKVDSHPKNKNWTTIDYILTVGTLEPRKNLKTLFNSFEMVSREHPSLNLIVVGRRGWIDSLDLPENVKEKIQFTGYVSMQELLSLYANARLFVFPSIYEGFGFPLLEAMASGVPVIASNTSSLPEIGGEACIYADPFSKEDFTEKIKMLLDDQKLHAKLIVEGRLRVKQFDWGEAVKKTWEVLRKYA